MSARERDRDDLLVVSGDCAKSAFNVETRKHVHASARTSTLGPEPNIEGARIATTQHGRGRRGRFV